MFSVSATEGNVHWIQKVTRGTKGTNGRRGVGVRGKLCGRRTGYRVRTNRFKIVPQQVKLVFSWLSMFVHLTRDVSQGSSTTGTQFVFFVINHCPPWRCTVVKQRQGKSTGKGSGNRQRMLQWNIKEWDALGSLFLLNLHWIRRLVRDAFLRRRIPFGTRTLLSILDVRKYENTVSQDLVSEGSLHATTHAFGRMPKSNAPSGFQRQRSIRFARPPRKSDVSQPRLSGKRRAGSRRQRGG